MSASTMKQHGRTRVGTAPRARRVLCSIGATILLSLAVTLGTGATPLGNVQNGAPSASPAASPAASPVAERSVPPTVFTTGEVTIEVADESIQPARIESAVGHELTLTVVNTGDERHGFVIDKLGVDLELKPGETATVEIGAPNLGEYQYYSDLPGDEGLAGKLTIFI